MLTQDGSTCIVLGSDCWKWMVVADILPDGDVMIAAQA